MKKNKRPFVIAFSGGCCSGKTTALNAIKDRLEQEGFRVMSFKADTHAYLKERNATIDSIRKVAFDYLRYQEFVCTEQWNFENQILREFYNDYDVILLDRSLFDCLFYTIYYFNLGDDGLRFGLGLERYYNLQLELYKHLQEAVDRVYDLTLCFEPLMEPKGEVNTFSRPSNIKMLKHIEGLGIRKVVDTYYGNDTCLPLGIMRKVDLNKSHQAEDLYNFITNVVQQHKEE